MEHRFTRDFKEKEIRRILIEKGYTLKTFRRLISESGVKNEMKCYKDIRRSTLNIVLAYKGKDDYSILVNEVINVLCYERPFHRFFNISDGIGAYETIYCSEILSSHRLFSVFDNEINCIIDKTLYK